METKQVLITNYMEVLALCHWEMPEGSPQELRQIFWITVLEAAVHHSFVPLLCGCGEAEHYGGKSMSQGLGIRINGRVLA